MPLYSKSDEVACLNMNSLLEGKDVDAEWHKGNGVIKSVDCSTIVPMEGESEIINDKPHLSSTFRFYNLVKTCAKEASASGAKKLALYVSKAISEINNQTSRGSTGLHACAYLKRWDLAQVLLDAGADPLCKNVAGHCFFLIATKDVSAPWESLLRCHPKLYEQHRVFLAQNAIKPRSTQRHTPSREKRLKTVQEKSVEVSVAKECGERDLKFEIVLNHAVDGNEWEQVTHLLSESKIGLSSDVMAADRALKMAKMAPPQVLKMLHTACFVFSPESKDVIVNRGVSENWVDNFWMQLGKSIHVSVQEEVLNTVLRHKKTQMILHMAQHGWSFGEDFIENCEEAGYFDVADRLIDLQSSLRPSLPVTPSNMGKKMVVSQIKSHAGLPRLRPKKNHTKERAPSKHKSLAESGSRKSKQGNARRSAMIANLDAPVREANEFEYKDKKPAPSTTIIIIKKARIISAGQT